MSVPSRTAGARTAVGPLGRPLTMLMGLAALLLVAVSAVACVRANVLPTDAAGVIKPLSEPKPFAYSTVSRDRDPTQVYRVGARDVIRVDVLKDPTLSAEYPVTDEGNILIPNIGTIHVGDLTTDEIQKTLDESLSTYIREPDTRVGVKEYNSKVIYVVGQVNKPGPQVMRADMLTLEEAIFGAGLTTSEAAMQRSFVIRPDVNNPIVYEVDLTDIIYKGKLRENILLQPNDRVYVPSRYSTNLRAALNELLGPIEDINRARRQTFVYGSGSNYSNSSSSSSRFP